MAKIKLDRPAKDISEFALTCVPKSLHPDDLERFYVETSEGRSPRQNFRRRLAQTLELNDPSSILVFGHRGCGKSSEIVRFQRDLDPKKWFCVGFSIIDEMNLTAIFPEDIILVLVERLLRKAKDEGMRISARYLKDMERFFAEEVVKTTQSRESELAVGAGVEAGAGALSGLLGLLAKVKGDIKFAASSERSYTTTIRKRPGDLILYVNNAIQGVQEALPQGRRLLIIVEDLDKISIANARRVFLENGELLARMETTVIYTIPIFTLHAPDAGQLNNVFGAKIGFPMIKVEDHTGERLPGFELVREIVHKRVERDLITPEAMNLLIEKTGGVLQHVFQVLNVLPSLNDVGVPVSVEDMRYALNLRRSEFYTEIALPSQKVEGLEKVEELYDRLEAYAKIQLKKERILPMPDRINQVLLSSAALVEYNENGSFRVHPLVVEILGELGRLPEQGGT